MGAEFPSGEMKKLRDDAVVVQPCEYSSIACFFCFQINVLDASKTGML